MLNKKRHIPLDCAFLLEFDMDKLRDNNLGRQKYWAYAVKAACQAGMRAAHCGALNQRAADGALFCHHMLPPQESLGVNAIVRWIQLDQCYCSRKEGELSTMQLGQIAYCRTHPYPSGQFALLRSNKV